MIPQRWKNWSVVASLAIASNIGAIAMLALEGIAFKNDGNAQVRPVEDSTLGGESSVVVPNILINGIPSDRIEGGAHRGNNLFHSFQSFNIAPDRGVYFTDPGVQNIFSRVTGNSPSDIQGRLGVLGNANLFLVNPNGIVFGPNARLDVRGSFLATTASAITFLDGTQFIASSTQSTPVLTINVPIGLQFGAIAHDIRVQGSELAVQDGRTLALVGNGVTVAGGRLLAPDGRVELQGVATGSVGLTVSGNNLFLSSPIENLANVSLTSGAQINVRNLGRGSITINAQNIRILEDSGLLAGIRNGTNSTVIEPGNITLRATDEITVVGATSLTQASEIINAVGVGAGGQAGNIDISGRVLRVTEGARIIASTFGVEGRAGDIIIRANEIYFAGGKLGTDGEFISTLAYSRVENNATGVGGTIQIINPSILSITDGAFISTSTDGQGNAGNIIISAPKGDIELDGVAFDREVASGIYSQVLRGAGGQGGEINITARTIKIRNGAAINTNTQGSQKAGNINIKQADLLVLEGRNGGSLSRLTSDTGDRANSDNKTGNGGDVTMNVRQLVVQNGARVSAESLTNGAGPAGTLEIQGADLVRVNGDGSEINFNTRSQREESNAGSLQISTNQLTVNAGGRISARTTGEGDAGRILVVAPESVLIDGAGSGLFFDSSAAGDAQQFEAIKIETNQLTVQNGGEVTVNGSGKGDPGNLVIEANSIFLTNQGKLIAETVSGKGGSIEIQVRDLLLLRFNSLISASAEGPGDGGNVTIQAPSGFVIAVLPENSDVVASAIQGTGGRAIGTAFGIYGFRQFRELRTPESDFTASSEVGFDGVLEINTQERDPLEELPIVLTEPDIAENCRALRAREDESKFILTNRGGLPTNPTEALESDAVQVDLVTRGAASTLPIPPGAIAPPPEPIVEAQGWRIDRNGIPVLIAHTPNPRPVHLG